MEVSLAPCEIKDGVNTQAVGWLFAASTDEAVIVATPPSS